VKALKDGKKRSRMRRLDEKIEFVAASATHLPFEKNSFELVTSFSVIDHLPNKKNAIQAIKEFSRVVRMSGFVVVTVPNKLFILGTLMMSLQNNFFEQRFTPRELASYFKDAGLTVFKCDSQYPTKVGSTVLKYNLPEVVQKIPAPLLQGMLNVGLGFFKFSKNHLPSALLGARFGFAALKIIDHNA
jgi:SAM-dependent methyltransferase